MAQNMEAVVGMDVNADPFLKELNDIFSKGANLLSFGAKTTPTENGEDKGLLGTLQNQLNELINLQSSTTNLDVLKETNQQIEKTQEAINELRNVKPEPDKNIGGIGKTLKGFIGFAGKMLAGISMMAVIMKVFQPAINIIQAGLKLIGELLRPISDIIIMLLQPLLMLIKPIVMAMRVLMAPFKQAAQQLAISGQKAMMSGTPEGMSAGIEMMMTAVGTMIGPFVTIIAAEALKLASNLLLTGIELLINSILDIISLIPGVSDKAVEEMKLKVSEGFNAAKTSINDAITGLEINILEKMADEVNVKIDEFKEKYPEYTDNLGTITSDFNSLIGNGGVIPTAATNMDEMKKSFDISSETNSFISNIKKLREALEEKNEKKITIGEGTVIPGKSPKEVAVGTAIKTTLLRIVRGS